MTMVADKSTVTVDIPLDCIPDPSLFPARAAGIVKSGRGQEKYLLMAFTHALTHGYTNDELTGSRTFNDEQLQAWQPVMDALAKDRSGRTYGAIEDVAALWSRWGFSPDSAAEWVEVGHVWEDHIAYRYANAGTPRAYRLAALLRDRTRKGLDGHPSMQEVQDAATWYRAFLRNFGSADAPSVDDLSAWYLDLWDGLATGALLRAGVTHEQAASCYLQGIEAMEDIIQVVIDEVPVEWVQAYRDSQKVEAEDDDTPAKVTKTTVANAAYLWVKSLDSAAIAGLTDEQWTLVDAVVALRNLAPIARPATASGQK